MKMKSYLLAILIFPLLACCSKEENVNRYDFTVLGIEKITINGVTKNTEQNGFPVKDDSHIVITRFANVGALNEYDLVIKETFSENLPIVVDKKYDDVSVVVESNSELKRKVVTITRKGYIEKVVYRVIFI